MTTAPAPAPVSWKQVAVQKQEVLRTGGEGQLIKEAKETRVIKIKFFGNEWSDLIVSLLGSGHFSDEKI